MKKIILTLSIAIASYFSYAQNSDPWPTSGNVGIGTTSPQSKLHIYQSTPDANGLVLQGNTVNYDAAQHYVALTFDGDYGNGTGNYSQIRSYSNLYSNWGSRLAFFTTQTSVANTLVERMRIEANGNVGIGTTNPVSKLDVNGGYITVGTSTTNKLYLDADATGGYIQTSGTSPMRFYLGSNEAIRILNSGNVGIGTTSPDEKLTVKGNVHAAEVKVEALSAIPDYVFEPDYKLTSLEELKAYLNKNHHLPEIPSAKEIEKNGIQIGDMSMKLLKTIEELTLHVIELNNQVKLQNEKITSLENQIKK